MSRVTNAGGHAISGQRIRHRGSLTHHEPVVPTYSRCHVGLERRALDLEDRVRSEQGVKPLVAQQLVAQNRLDGAAGLTPAANDVGREHDADAGLTRGDRNVPHPAQIAVSVVHEECRSVIERRRVEVGPQTHLLLAVRDGRNIQRARQHPRGSAGIDVPTGFHTATAGRRAAGDPIAVRVDIRHALPDELCAERTRVVEEPCIERGPVHVQCHRLETQRRSTDDRRRCGAPLGLPEFAHDDLLLVGGDVVGDESVRVDTDAPEQAGTRPIERLADLSLRILVCVEADDTQAGVAQQDTRGESCDAGSDNRYIVSFVTHASSLSQTRACPGYTPRKAWRAASGTAQWRIYAPAYPRVLIRDRCNPRGSGSQLRPVAEISNGRRAQECRRHPQSKCPNSTAAQRKARLLWALACHKSRPVRWRRLSVHRVRQRDRRVAAWRQSGAEPARGAALPAACREARKGAQSG